MSVQETEFRQELESLFDNLQITMQDRDNKRGRINAALRVVQKFTFTDFQAAARHFKVEDAGVWPSPGKWTTTCSEMYRQRTGRGQPRDDRSGSFSNIDGHTFQDIMNSQEGERAKARGNPGTFLDEVRSGKIPVSSLSFRK